MVPENLLIAAGEIFSPVTIAYIVLGVLIGYIVGALPGMNRTTAIALAIPFTFTMPPAELVKSVGPSN
jgi:putative tricarboxylic transport membrane protein